MAVDPHKHCPICGTPIPLNELVCSPDCQKVWDARLKQRKRSQIILYVVIAIFLIIWAVTATVVGSEYIFPTVSKTFSEIISLLSEKEFYLAFLSTLFRSLVSFVVS